MSTRAHIAVEHSDGHITGVFLLYDGYIAHTGRILFKYHSDYYSASELISGGTITSLVKWSDRVIYLNDETDGVSHDGTYESYIINCLLHRYPQFTFLYLWRWNVGWMVKAPQDNSFSLIE